MSLREILLTESNGVLMVAAAEFARGLNLDSGAFKAGYSEANAILASVEMFPEVTEDQIRVLNGWGVDGE